MSLLNLQDRAEIADFIDMLADYLPDAERREAVALVAQADQDQSLAVTELAEQAWFYAKQTWTVRRAVQRFIASDVGADQEWLLVLAAVQPTTALLLSRVRVRYAVASLGQALVLPEASVALQGETREELELVRPEVWVELWRTQSPELLAELREAKTELEERHHRLEKLERFSQAMTTTTRAAHAALRKKTQGFEERLYLGGEAIPLEELDEALQLTIGDVLTEKE